VTANRVGDGAVVYRRADGGSATHLGRGAGINDPHGARPRIAAQNPDRAGALGRINAATADDVRATGPYVAPDKLGASGHVRPGNLRELIRLGGPTIELPVTFGI